MHISFLNQQATINNAKKILSQYQSLHNLERSLKLTIKSPIISDMPKSEPVGNSQEDKIVDKFEQRNYAHYFCQLIRDVVGSISNETYSEIIKQSYLDEAASDRQIMTSVNLENTQFYRCKREALLVFAQIMPVFKDINGNIIDLCVYI